MSAMCAASTIACSSRRSNASCRCGKPRRSWRRALRSPIRRASTFAARSSCGRDVRIDVGCVFEGDVTLADGVTVGPYCVLRDVAIGGGHGHRAVFVPGRRQRGRQLPYRPLRAVASRHDAGRRCARRQFRRGQGEHHRPRMQGQSPGLCWRYARSAADVNFGAGAITANYDGAHKHQTIIGDHASIGSNCVLVAPVTIGAGATIGAGSVIAQDAPAGAPDRGAQPSRLRSRAGGAR